MTDSDYCVQHGHLFREKSIDKDIRIPCPLDPKHTCSKSKVSKHLSKCNAARSTSQDPWYVPGINSLGNRECDDELVNLLKNVAEDECRMLIESLYKVASEDYETMQGTNPHPALSNELETLASSAKALRQTKQNSALLCVMENCELLSESACFIEFGAGRGQFATSVIKALGPLKLPSNAFVLIDRSGSRRKLDAKHRQEDDITIERIRCDIKDLSLEHVKTVAHHIDLPLVAISKHLCGVATDYALRCLVNTHAQSCIKGGVMALCCHHRCVWSEYCGKEYFCDLGFSARDFSIISLLSSWAVCGFRDSATEHDNIAGHCFTEAPYKFHFLQNSEKEKIGAICKMLINHGRMHYLRKVGFKCKLIEYTSKSVSLENVALTFVRQ